MHSVKNWSLLCIIVLVICIIVSYSTYVFVESKNKVIFSDFFGTYSIDVEGVEQRLAIDGMNKDKDNNFYYSIYLPNGSYIRQNKCKIISNSYVLLYDNSEICGLLFYSNDTFYFYSNRKVCTEAKQLSTSAVLP